MSWTKVPCLATLVVNNLRLSKTINDPFQIEWERSGSTGMTERAFANAQNEIFFGKMFRFKVTMYIKKKDESVRQKFVAVTVIRYADGNKRKVFGTLQLDVGPYYNKPVLIDTDFNIDSPHEGQTVLSVSIQVTPDRKGKVGDTDDVDLSTLSESFHFHSITRDDWDTSDQKALDKFLMKKQDVTSTPSLGAYMSSIPEKRMRLSRKHLTAQISNDKLSDADDAESKLSSFLSQKGKRRSARRSLLGSSTNLMMMLTPPTEFQDRGTEPHDAAKNLLRSVLLKLWGSGPVEPDDVPLASAAIYAAIVHTELLKKEPINDDDFRTVVVDFIGRYEKAGLMENSKARDRFIVTLYLLGLVKQGLFDFDQQRMDDMAKELIANGKCDFNDYIREHHEPFGALAISVIEGTMDSDQFVTVLDILIKEAKQDLAGDKVIGNFGMDYIARKLDADLVNALVSRPDSCTFGKAATWNSMVTIISSDYHFELPLFKAALTCLTMSMTLCEVPDELSVLCPDLPEAVAWKIMSNQRPDDFMPVINNTTKFKDHYKISTASSPHVRSTYDGDFGELVSQLDLSSWTAVKFDDDTLEAFSYLKSYFG